jgi:DNA-directed RNA polymerase alpha subunit
MPQRIHIKLTADDPIDELDLNARAHNHLLRHGIDTVGQLTALTELDLRGVREIGAGTLDNIVGALEAHGLKLAGGAR